MQIWIHAILDENETEKTYYQIKPRWTTAVYLVSDDRTQELGLTLLGRVPMPALYPHTSLVYSSYYHNIHIYSLCLHTSFLRVISHHGAQSRLQPAAIELRSTTGLLEPL